MLPRMFAFLALMAALGLAGSVDRPYRWEAQYTLLYQDDIETPAPALNPGFVLLAAGSLTSNSAEVVSGSGSIKGASPGTGSYSPFLRTDLAHIPLSANHAYRIEFKYRILMTPDQGFAVLFDSVTGNAEGKSLPHTIVKGLAGDSGTATHISTLGPYGDYQAYWAIQNSGAIAIDDVVITDVTTGTPAGFENCEATAANAGPGLRVIGGSPVRDPELVLAGSGSLRLSRGASVVTNPQVWPLAPNSVYIVEFDYRVLSPGSGDETFVLWLQPATAEFERRTAVDLPPLLRNAPASGTFSSGALTAGADVYELHIAAATGADVLIDNVAIHQRDAVPVDSPPAAWSRLAALPFPRIGKYMLGTSLAQALTGGMAEGPALRISVDQVESRLAFADVIAGLHISSQTMTADSLRRLRQLNPGAVVLPYRISQEQITDVWIPDSADVMLDATFLQSVADEWYLRDTKGEYVPDPDYPGIRKMNIPPLCPVVGGQTFFDYLLEWLQGPVFSSGVWDGVFFDNLFGRINPHIPNATDPALLDADYNRNGLRDETPAAVSEMTRAAAAGMLQQLRDRVGDSQLVLGNSGPVPELALAPYVNGYTMECINAAWESVAPNITTRSQAAWRKELDAYRALQAATRHPGISILEGCGPSVPLSGGVNSEPTAADLERLRLTLGTALLSDAFYSYDLHGSASAPMWFDEYSVDSTGVAVEDRSKKGYLGQALSEAVELAPPGTLVLEENFETGTMPASFSGGQGVSVSRETVEVISGTGSLVLSNPNHTTAGTVSSNTSPQVVQFAAAGTYRMVFDWRVLETLDSQLYVFFGIQGRQPVDQYTAPGVVKGDAGTASFPLTLPSTGEWTFNFLIPGGGKVAIDNFRLYQGGVGPWRRDFENGFVLVNPLSQPRTFTSAEIAGSLGRTGVYRIKGTQAPDVNNGLPVTDTLTVPAFDAIVLLADHIGAPGLQNSGATPLATSN